MQMVDHETIVRFNQPRLTYNKRLNKLLLKLFTLNCSIYVGPRSY